MTAAEVAAAPGAMTTRGALQRPIREQSADSFALHDLRGRGRRQGRIVTQGQPRPLWADAAERQLNELLALEPGWDGYRAREVADAAVETTVELLDRFMDEAVEFPDLFPLNDGGIQIEWHADDVDIEIEVSPEGDAFVLATGPDDALLAEGELFGPEGSHHRRDLASALHTFLARLAAAAR
jgi:hypothetical protein